VLESPLNLVSVDCFEKVQSVFRGHNKPKSGARDSAYRGLLRSAYDYCKLTAEIKQDRNTYYRCIGFRGKCGFPYIREEELGDRLAHILKAIHIPDSILSQFQETLLSATNREEEIRKQQGERLAERLSQECNAGCIRLTRTSWTEKSAKNSGCEGPSSGTQRKPRFESQSRD
jgi:hypothetical protein